VTGDEKWVHYDNPKRRKSWRVPGHASIDGQTEYSRLQGYALYLVGPAQRSVLWTVKTDWNNHRRSKRNWCVWAEHWKTNAIQRDTIKWFCSMTMLDPMLRKWSRHTWKRWNRKSYPTGRILQTLLPLTITCFDQWHTAWLTSTSCPMKK